MSEQFTIAQALDETGNCGPRDVFDWYSPLTDRQTDIQRERDRDRYFTDDLKDVSVIDHGIPLT